MYYRPRPRPASSKPPEPTLSQLALAEIKRREEEEAPLGGWGGEIVVPHEPQPGVVFGPPLRPEPPDWDAEHREFVERERAEQARQDELRLERLAREREQDKP